MIASRRGVLAGSAALLGLAGRPRAQSGKILRFGLQTTPPSLGPWEQVGTSATTLNLCHRRGLLSYAPDGSLRAELAESWESDGSTGWVFKLREAWFHNGKPVTSEDVRWTLEQIAEPRSTAFFRTTMQGIERIETPDGRTVRLILKEPSAVLPYWFAAPHMAICSRDAPAASPRSVSAGPYVMDASERGTFYSFKPFDRFYRPGVPKLSELRFIVYADENLRVAALQAGDVDLIEYVPWQSITMLDADSRFRQDKTDGPFMYLTFNARSGPLADARVRQAIAYAVNRDEVTKAAFFGHGAALGGLPIASSSPFYDAGRANHWRHDPARAKALLAEAGAADGFSLLLLSNITNGMHKNTAEIVQQNLAQIGIQVQLSLPDWPTYVAQANRGQFDLAVNGTTGDNPDPDGLSSIIDCNLPAHFSRSQNLPVPELTRLLARGRSELSLDRRKEIYAEVERLFLEQVTMVPLVARTQAYAMRQGVSGFRNLAGQLTFFSGVTLEDADIA